MRSGFVAIIGLANAGKSSILNAVVGEKVSIVTPKPQTTRSRIRGIYNDSDSQIIFTDTPGLVRSKNKLNDYMNSEISAAASDNDIILLVIDALKGVTDRDIELIKKYGESKNLIVALNKTDKLEGGGELKIIDAIKDYPIAEIVPLSAKSGHNLEILINIIKGMLTDSTLYYDSDSFTDSPMAFLASEIIREKLLLVLNQEVPHGIAVDIEEYKVEEGLVRIGAVIICERQSHKAIIIGKGGSVLKRIGTYAREDLEELTGSKVFLKTFVKVSDNWRDNPRKINEYGYKS